jgi:putative membrane protein
MTKKVNEVKNENKFFKYVIFIAVLIIPFMYSFFYLKAYWNPYGEGNIDNLPVAIVNEDTGDKGEELIDSIKDSGKLKISITTEKNANNGLNSGKYYAVITIPEDFTESMNSASSEEKKHATITYSPNQKSNYLASQIINSVVNAVEKNLDNSVNSAIIEELSNKLSSVPDQLQTISDGFSSLQSGTSQIKEGTEELKNGIDSAYTGSKTILDSVNANIDSMKNKAAIDSTTLEGIKSQAVNSVSLVFTDEYKNAIGNEAITALYSNEYYQQLKTGIETLENAGITNDLVSLCTSSNIPDVYITTCTAYSSYIEQYKTYNTMIELMEKTAYQTAISVAEETAKQTASSVSESVATNVANIATNQTIASLEELSSGLNELTNGLSKVNTGATTLLEGTTTLNNSVISAKEELDENISNSKNEIKSLDGLAEYAKEPVSIETETVNEINSYGTAFAPLFISIALWVGCLMMFVIFYYDKNNRFKILGIENKNRVQRNLCYYLTATLAGIILGVLLQCLLDLDITNIFLYYISIILVANTFMAIMQFLIINFNDIGKFIALIILVLQLAAAGGTFPIETVTSGFRWMHNLLPMTYTIRLIRESVVSIESNLLTKNLIIVISILVIFFLITLISDIIRQKKEK